MKTLNKFKKLMIVGFAVCLTANGLQAMRRFAPTVFKGAVNPVIPGVAAQLCSTFTGYGVHNSDQFKKQMELARVAGAAKEYLCTPYRYTGLTPLRHALVSKGDDNILVVVRTILGAARAAGCLRDVLLENMHAGFTPLHMLLINSDTRSQDVDLALAKEFLRSVKGGDVWDVFRARTDLEKNTVLMCACDNPEMTEAIVACAWDNVPLLQEMLTAKNDLSHCGLQDVIGNQTALDCACRAGCLPVVRILTRAMVHCLAERPEFKEEFSKMIERPILNKNSDSYWWHSSEESSRAIVEYLNGLLKYQTLTEQRNYISVTERPYSGGGGGRGTSCGML